MLRIDSLGTSDCGLKRPNNEDVFVVREDLGMVLVADGMGGAAAGEIASHIFADTALAVFTDEISGGINNETLDINELSGDASIDIDDPANVRSDKTSSALVRQTFQLANTKIHDHVMRNPQHAGMGCTADLMAVFNGGFVLGHVGDSRTYRFRNGVLTQLTQDHSLIQSQLDNGIITQTQARNHALKNVILRAVGVDRHLSLDIVRGRYFPGDLFLMCSDGLTDMVEDADIATVLASNGVLQQKLDQLITLAKAGGGRDNITVVLLVVVAQ